MAYEREQELEPNDLRPKPEPPSEAHFVLLAASNVMQMLQAFKNDVVPCIPASYDAVRMCIDCLDCHLRPVIQHLLRDGMSRLLTFDIVKLIDWLDFFVGAMGTITSEANSCAIVMQFKDSSLELLHEYLERIKSQIKEWFANIKSQGTYHDVYASDGAGGILVTSAPEDMFNIVHMQIEVAEKKLPRARLKDTANACIQVLREVQRDWTDVLTNDWKDMGPEEIAASVNDNQRMQEKVSLLYCTVLCCTVLYCTVLYCTIAESR